MGSAYSTVRLVCSQIYKAPPIRTDESCMPARGVGVGVGVGGVGD